MSINGRTSWQGKISSKSCAAQCARLVGKMVQLSSYGSFMKDLLLMSQKHLSFCPGATYATLPSPSILHFWHINPETLCLICRRFVLLLWLWSMYHGPVLLHISS